MTLSRRASQAETDSQEHRRLMVVFFDILYKDGSSLLQESYETRRSILEDAITPKLGYSCLSSRESIDLHREAESTEKLCNIFARHVASHKEGVVLKSGDAQYNDPSLPWVKVFVLHCPQ
jgi:DNA ligase 4